VLTKEGIHILANVIIVDPMQVDLLPWSCVTQKFVTFDALKPRKRATAIDTPLISSFF
jgi:hypothetical protein